MGFGCDFGYGFASTRLAVSSFCGAFACVHWSSRAVLLLANLPVGAVLTVVTLVNWRDSIYVALLVVESAASEELSALVFYRGITVGHC